MSIAVEKWTGARRRRSGHGLRSATVAPEAAQRWVEQPRDRDEPVSPELLRARWRIAFDAAQSALRAGSLYLPAAELREHRELLAAEREPTAQLLREFARNQGTKGPFVHLLHSPRAARRLLRLPPEVVACIFNLDGILIGSAAVHASAWTETFDEFVSRRVDRTRGSFAPFNPRVDYARYIHGRPRLDGVRAFLASRGVRLPEGEPDDPPGSETVHGLANRKNAALLQLLDKRGLTAFDGARDYLETARDAGIGCAVVSASANTDTILERAGLANLIDGRIDGNTIVAEHLAPRPEPDIVLAACRQIGTDARHAAVFETTAAGITAARTAGAAFVVGVDRSGETRALLDAGADLVVAGLDDILDRQRAA